LTGAILCVVANVFGWGKGFLYLALVCSFLSGGLALLG